MAHFYGHSQPADGRREASLEEKERGEMPSDIRKARKVFSLLEPKYRRLGSKTKKCCIEKSTYVLKLTIPI